MFFRKWIRKGTRSLLPEKRTRDSFPCNPRMGDSRVFSVTKKHLSLPFEFSILKHAGISVETLMVLPLFLFGMITLISFLDIFRIQMVHLSKLCEQAKYEALLEWEGSKREELILTDSYSIHLPGLLVPIPDQTMENRIRIHSFTGRNTGTDQQGGQEASAYAPDTMVYIARTGHVIHSDPHCTYLHLSVRQIAGSSISSETNRYGAHYHSCEICSRGDEPGAIVYVTEEGTRYHNSGSCRGLSRTVRLVPESEVSGWKYCSRCGS